jgi:hypothetical protein
VAATRRATTTVAFGAWPEALRVAPQTGSVGPDDVSSPTSISSWSKTPVVPPLLRARAQQRDTVLRKDATQPIYFYEGFGGDIGRRLNQGLEQP